MKLYDSLRRELVDFAPLAPPRVAVYGCGPTVYDFAHIGNFRTFLVYDLLHRHLRARGHEVEFVVNLTDVDDKTIEGAAEAGLSLGEHTEPFVRAFREDAKTLGLLPFSQHPRATEFVPVMTGFIERLLARGHAYSAADGSVYYSVSSFENYGRLSGCRADAADMGAGRPRIDADDYEKGDARDFALWKAARPADRAAGAVWDSPWGEGRPGWHLECSAMSITMLGDTIDVHLGGEDLLFPHHENEIAQSEAATAQPFARYWMHVKHLKVEGRKMSKSAGNFHTVRDLLNEGRDPAAIRWILLSAHYRSELDFTRSGLAAAETAVQRLLDFRRRVHALPSSAPGPLSTPASAESSSVPGPASARNLAAANSSLARRARHGLDAFLGALDDDLNVPRALAELWTLVREANAAMDAAPNNVSAEDRTALLQTLAGIDAVLGVLDLAEASRKLAGGVEERIEGLVAARDEARARRDFEAADRIRDELAAEGVRIEDTPGGTRWTKVRPGGG